MQVMRAAMCRCMARSPQRGKKVEERKWSERGRRANVGERVIVGGLCSIFRGGDGREGKSYETGREDKGDWEGKQDRCVDLCATPKDRSAITKCVRSKNSVITQSLHSYCADFTIITQ